MNRATALLAVLLLVASGAASAQIYKYIDREGRTVYSETPPPPDARKVEAKRMGGNFIETDDMPYALKDAIAKNPVTLYVAGNKQCGELCANARELLSKRGVPFAERNVESGPAEADALKKLAGGELRVPTLVVGTAPSVGFEAASWNGALDSAGYPKTNALAAATRKLPSEPAPKGAAGAK